MAQDQINIHDDPEFHALPAAEKHKVLMSEDADYRGMQPSEQAKALDEIHYGNLGRDESKFTGGGRNRLADTIDKWRGGAENVVRGGLKRFGLPTNEREADHFMGQEPGQKPALKELIDSHMEAGEKSPVGYVPLIGPGAVSASEHVRKHEYGEAAGDIGAGVVTLAPFKGAGLKLSDAVGAAARTPEGALRPSVQAGAELTGTVAGMNAVQSHPYVGAGIGYKAAPRLLDAITPERAPVKPNPFKIDEAGGNWTPYEDTQVSPVSDRVAGPETPTRGQMTLSRKIQAEGDVSGEHTSRTEGPDSGEFYEHRGTDLMKRGKETRLIDKLSEESTGKVTVLPGGKPGKGPLTPEQVPGKPQLKSLAKQGDSRAGQELQRRGEKIVYQGEPDVSERRERINLKDAVSDSQELSGGRPVSRKGQNLPKDSADRMAERTGSTRGQLEREQAEAERSTKRTLRNNIRLKDKLTPESSGAQRANEVQPMDKAERADLEKQAGRKFTSDQEANDYRRKAAEWTGNQALAKGTVDTDVKRSTGLRDVQKKAGYGTKLKDKLPPTQSHDMTDLSLSAEEGGEHVYHGMGIKDRAAWEKQVMKGMGGTRADKAAIRKELPRVWELMVNGPKDD